MTKNRYWSEIRSNHINDEGFVCIDAWKTADDNEEGCVIAYVDTFSGRIIYVDPMARVDEYAQEVILEVFKKYQKEHPFSVEELENLAKGVVEFENEESPADGYQNMEAMGFSEDQMRFFGFDVNAVLSEEEEE